MLKYVLQRISTSLLTLFVIITLTFFLMRAIPGGPFTDEKVIPPEIMDRSNAFGVSRYRVTEEYLP